MYKHWYNKVFSYYFFITFFLFCIFIVYFMYILGFIHTFIHTFLLLFWKKVIFGNFSAYYTIKCIFSVSGMTSALLFCFVRVLLVISLNSALRSVVCSDYWNTPFKNPSQALPLLLNKQPKCFDFGINIPQESRVKFSSFVQHILDASLCILTK